MKIKIIIIVIALNVLNIEKMNAQGCDIILSAGVYDYHNTTSSTEKTDLFINWFRQKNFSSYQEAKNSGMSIGLPIDGVLTSLNYSTNESGFQMFKNDVETYQNQQSTFKQKIVENIQTISQPLIDAWSRCVGTNGMHFWFEQTLNPKVFTVFARYVSDGYDPNPPKLISINFTPSGYVKKSTGAFFDNNGNTKQIKFNGSLASQSFLRTDSAGFSIDIRASRGGVSLKIPEIKRPPTRKPLPFAIGTSFTKTRRATSSYIIHSGGTNSSYTGGNEAPIVDNDKIEIVAPADGYYSITAKGTYRNEAYTSPLDIYYSIYSNFQGRLKIEQVATNVANFTAAIPSVVAPIMVTRTYLKKGEMVELRYGNSGDGNGSHSFRYGYPNDYISIVYLGQ